MRKLRIYISVILFTALTASCISGGDHGYGKSYIKEGDPVPSFEVSNDSGPSFVSPRDFAEKISLLLFFDTGCGDCRREMPIVNAAWEMIRSDEDFQFVAISRVHEPEKITTYWTDNSFSMPAYWNNGRNVYYMFAERTIPRLYIVNEKGTVVWMSIEKFDITPSELADKIRSFK